MFSFRLFNRCTFQNEETTNAYDNGIVSFKLLKDFCFFMSDCVDETPDNVKKKIWNS